MISWFFSADHEVGITEATTALRRMMALLKTKWYEQIKDQESSEMFGKCMEVTLDGGPTGSNGLCTSDITLPMVLDCVSV